MREDIDPQSITEYTFRVTAKDYQYTAYEIISEPPYYNAVPAVGDFERTVTGVSTAGRIVTLDLLTEYGFLGPKDGQGMAYGTYLVELLEPVATPAGKVIQPASRTFTVTGSVNPLVDRFIANRFVLEEPYTETIPWSWGDQSGSYDVTVDGIDYRLFEPATSEPAALVVWMHGGGEGGEDNRKQITANKVTAWADTYTQSLFGGAYILAPQAPTSWNTAYNRVLLELIKEIIATKNVDPDRVYIGGCSMGGLGTWLAILEEPGLFAAAFPICQAYDPTAEELAAVVDLPIWMVAAQGDGTMALAANSYNRLKGLGAENVYISQFSKVLVNGNEEYIDHFSWVYVHDDFSEAKNASTLYDADDEILYDAEMYPNGWICENSYAPEDLGYASFQRWLAAQTRPAVTLPESGKLEAEDALLSGAAVVETFSDGLCVGHLSEPSGAVKFRFSAEREGMYDLALRVSPTSADALTEILNVTVNGIKAAGIDMPAAPYTTVTYGDITYKSVTDYYAFLDVKVEGIYLSAGENTIVLTSNATQGWFGYVGAPNVDYILLTDVNTRLFNIEMTCFDWGQNVTKIPIDMGQPVDASLVDAETFRITAKNLSYYDWGTGKTITADFPRTVGSVTADGNTLILTLTTDFSTSTAAGNGFGSYEVVQTKDIGTISAGSIRYLQNLVYDPLADRFERRTNAAGTADAIDYRLFVPDAEKYAEPADGYPLILWLHGAGESGTDNHAQISANRVTAWIEDSTQSIFGGAFVMAPQNHSPEKTLAALYALLDEFDGADGKPRIDPDRLYIGGCSMGGAGTWNTILAAPDLFAAAFPICPASTPTQAQMESLMYIPIWLIHSITDNTCNVSTSINAYNNSNFAHAK